MLMQFIPEDFPDRPGLYACMTFCHEIPYGPMNKEFHSHPIKAFLTTQASVPNHHQKYNSWSCYKANVPACPQILSPQERT